MAFEGMDPGVVKDISVKMDAQAKALASVLTVVQGQVDRARTAWQGPAASTFESSWNSRHKPALVNAHDQLSTMSVLLKSEATAQTVTSDEIAGVGGGSGALPTGGAGGNAGGAGATGRPGGPDDGGIEGLAPIDKVLWALGSPFLAATTGALGRLGVVGAKGVYDLSRAGANYARGAQYLANEVTAGRLTQSAASASLTELGNTLNESRESVTGGLSKAYKFLGDGGLPDFTLGSTAARSLGALGAAGGVLGFVADGRTLLDPKASGWQKGAAALNAAGTAVTLPAAVAAVTGTELTGAFAAGALIPGVGEAVLLGSAAYLAYTQIGWVHDGVNAAAKGVYDGVKWVGNEEIKATQAVVSGAEDLGKGALHEASNLAGDVGSGVSHAGSAVKKFFHL